MKGILKKFVCFMISAVALIGFAGCSQDAITAYEIAVKNGFVGTEAEWLQSLHGADGEDGADLKIEDVYAWAKEKGYAGTYEEFLKELNIDVHEDNATETIAKNLTSVVEVCCGFTKTVEYKSGWSTSTKTYVGGSAGSGVIYSVNRNAGTAIIITNYHVVYSNGVKEGISGVDQENGISDCIWLYPYGELNYFSTGDEKQDGLITDADTDDIKDSEQGDTSGHGIRARFIGGAMEYDIAVLETEVDDDYFGVNGKATPASFGDSNAVTVGEKVFAIGNANGQGLAVTSGALSVESEYIVMASPDGTNTPLSFRVMRTDSAINHGNSGGGLFNAQGEVIGITNAKSVQQETDNMGYALPITQVKYLVENMLDNRAHGGYVFRATLGIYTEIVNSGAKIENGKITVTEEFIVSSTQVLPGSSAYGKLSYADVIKGMTVHGKKHVFTRSFQLNDLLLTIRKGDVAVLHIVRDGTARDITITFDKETYFTKSA